MRNLQSTLSQYVMEKPWLKSYPPGVPETIGEPQYSSLAHFFEEMAARYRERPALSNLGRTLCYAELEELSRHFASFLNRRLGLERGERIAIMLPNVSQQPVALWGALRAGLIVVNTNPLYSARELEHQLQDSGAAALVMLENFVPAVAAALPRLKLKAIIISGLGDLLRFPRSYLINWYVRLFKTGNPGTHISEAVSFNTALQEGSLLSFERHDLKLEDVAFLQYTGGTTGIAKGAMLTHRNLLANVEQCTQWIVGGLPPERAMVKGEEVVITALPLYHIFALTVDLLCFTELGGLNYLITNPRDLQGLIKMLGKVRFSVITGVNTLFKGLLNTPGFDELDFSSLKFVISGGMPTEEAVANRWQQVTGCPITEGYGLTETSPVVSVNPPGLTEFNGSIGLPVPSTECSVRDDDGRPLPVGTAGELYVRGPQVMKGYWNSPDETENVMTPDGWLRTGDIARMDENGFFYIVDRKKDMILVSGFNVYPNELEAVLSTHPAVRECAAIGVPDDKTGETVKVFIVRKDESLDADTVRRYCRMNLAAYKVPKYIEFRDELPKSAVGKILRRELRKLT
ncbi:MULTISPECIES: AMP-binding protein [unclassified Methylocaldum]|jgi:long-chain acyl-CoA synthetase|uniref:AMP-binding protein n=1 Tax=unclassified Methylocaldum TaxID=2622260 RepID=UPI00197B5A42|nr:MULTISPECIES: AMP-binding protein [unclassified Methylocaldum]MBP1151203.1 long-chain acyl-CoA synthetase [Methylocaldum sp. RMAD-M]